MRRADAMPKSSDEIGKRIHYPTTGSSTTLIVFEIVIVGYRGALRLVTRIGSAALI